MADRPLLTRNASAFQDVLKPSELEALRATADASVSAVPGVSGVSGMPGMSDGVRICPTPIDGDPTSAASPLGPNEAPAASCPAHDDGLTPAQRLAIGQLLCGSTMSACAARLGVSVRTLHRWRQQPAFAAVLHARSVEALEASCVRARNLMLKSTEVLADALRHRDATRWAVRILQMSGVRQLAQTLPAVAEGPPT